MGRLINRVFSDKYINYSAVGGNIFLLLMYRFAYPFAFILNKLHLSPNQITTLSFIFSIIAFYIISYTDKDIWFVVFWGLSLLFDFCDGTVARMTKNIGKTAFRYDHNSDLWKINLVFLGAGIHYNDKYVWITALLASFLFMYYTILNHELAGYINNRKIINKPENNKDTLVERSSLKERYRIVAWFVKSKSRIRFYQNIFSMFIVINGHTLLLFLLVPFGMDYSISIFSYFSIISFIGCRARIRELILLPK